MKKFVIKRLINAMIAFVLIVTMYSIVLDKQLDLSARATIKFAMAGVTPPADALKNKTPEEVQKITRDYKLKFKAAMEKMYGLDKPYLTRVFQRTWNSIRYKLGKSRWLETPFNAQFTPPNSSVVKHLILEALPHTLILFVSTTILSVIIGIIFGVIKARWFGTVFDKITSILTMFFYGIPTWWIGSFMILIFVYKLKILPFGAQHSYPPPQTTLGYIWDRLQFMSLPLLTILITRLWGPAFMIKNILLQPLQEDYIMSARARGIPEKKVLFGHTLRSAAPAIVTLSVISVVTTIAGDIILEKILAWPGIGSLFWEAVQFNDIYVMTGVLVTITLFYVCSITVLDFIYALLDPRIKY